MAKDDQRSFRQYGSKKKELFKGVKGRILEIGPGTGVNLRFFDKDVNWIGIEPNQAMHPYLKSEAERLGINAEIKTGMSEHVHIENESVDHVVSTIVLCSVKNVENTLNEIKRVLKPGGTFLFLEHQADKPWTWRRMIQNIVPYTRWRYFSDGCTPSRSLGRAIESVGFEKVSYQEFMQEGSGIILAINRPHICGWAKKKL